MFCPRYSCPLVTLQRDVRSLWISTVRSYSCFRSRLPKPPYIVSYLYCPPRFNTIAISKRLWKPFVRTYRTFVPGPRGCTDSTWSVSSSDPIAANYKTQRGFYDISEISGIIFNSCSCYSVLRDLIVSLNSEDLNQYLVDNLSWTYNEDRLIESETANFEL